MQIVSKLGIHFDMSSLQTNRLLVPNSKPEVIRASVEGTLKCLQTDYIDLYFQHRIDPNIEPEIVANVMAEQNRELLELLNKIAEQKNVTPAQLSKAWMLCRKPWIVPIPGTRKPERLKENAGAADVKLTKKEVRELDEALDNMEMSEVF